MNFWAILFDLLVLLAVAMVLGAIAARLKQSAIIGYMLAGVLMGPHVFAVLKHGEAVRPIADLGVTLLMFTIGLEFNWSRLRRMGATALISGTLQITVTTAIGAMIAAALGAPGRVAFAIGMILALSSTAVVLPILQKRSEVDTVHGRFGLGILLVQDVAVVPMMLIVGALGGGGSAFDVFKGSIQSFGIVAAFIMVCFAFSRFVLPSLVRFGASTGIRDIPILFAVVAIMASSWAAQAVSLSPALGAFIAAIFLGESLMSTQLRSDVGPFKSVFTTLFFSVIGMYADPVWAWEHLSSVVGLTALVIIGKPIIVAAVAKCMRLTLRHAITTGTCLCQIGLFSFVLARLANTPAAEDAAPLMNDNIFSLLVTVTVATLFVTPYGVALGPWLGATTERKLRQWGWVKGPQRDTDDDATRAGGHVVVVGFGPAGREVAEAVLKQGLGLVVLDLNPHLVMKARNLKMESYVGDASNPDVLRLAGIDNAGALAVTIPDHRLATAAIVEARALNATISVIARARYHRYADLLRGAGSHIVIDEEEQVGKRLGEEVLSMAEKNIPTEKHEPSQHEEAHDETAG